MSKITLSIALILTLALPASVLADDRSTVLEKIEQLRNSNNLDTNLSLRSDTNKLVGIWEIDDDGDSEADFTINIKAVETVRAGRRFIFDRVSVTNNSSVIASGLVGHFINNRMFFSYPLLGSNFSYAVKINKRASFGIGTQAFSVDLFCDFSEFPENATLPCDFQSIESSLIDDVRMTKK